MWYNKSVRARGNKYGKDKSDALFYRLGSPITERGRESDPAISL